MSAPVRPAIGDAIVAYWSCTFAFSTAARSASTVASRAAAVARLVSTCSVVAMPRPLRSAYRWATDLALAACAMSRCRLACAASNAASSGRRSSAKSTWPFATSSPSLKLTSCSCPVICACTDTTEYASTEPITRISIGIDFWTTCATVTGTVGSPPRPPRPRPAASGARRRRGAFAGTRKRAEGAGEERAVGEVEETWDTGHGVIQIAARRWDRAPRPFVPDRSQRRRRSPPRTRTRWRRRRWTPRSASPARA